MSIHEISLAVLATVECRHYQQIQYAIILCLLSSRWYPLPGLGMGGRSMAEGASKEIRAELLKPPTVQISVH